MALRRSKKTDDSSTETKEKKLKVKAQQKTPAPKKSVPGYVVPTVYLDFLTEQRNAVSKARLSAKIVQIVGPVVVILLATMGFMARSAATEAAVTAKELEGQVLFLLNKKEGFTDGISDVPQHLDARRAEVGAVFLIDTDIDTMFEKITLGMRSVDARITDMEIAGTFGGARSVSISGFATDLTATLQLHKALKDTAFLTQISLTLGEQPEGEQGFSVTAEIIEGQLLSAKADIEGRIGQSADAVTGENKDDLLQVEESDDEEETE